MFHDRNDNEIELAVEKNNGKVYFGLGWEVLQRFYKIDDGTWVTLVMQIAASFWLSFETCTMNS